ncbi:hypothetical protein GDO86_003927 [Hymenochirus boettgeri]|uniref:Transcription elongation factor A N-terminal and central domain-containing protein n=1 Tax=Hymenochirus boettgeri TaxID=247094 RepID=A0A8T2K963_9PIPI|nr:hypothetical protein GDO86_003927 [Hymenochirus boettgeri]
MLRKGIFKDLISRALEVESLLAERKYEDIEFHLMHFETAEITSELLQESDIVRIVYRVLKSSPQGCLKLKAKILLSKWKELFRKSCHDTSNINKHHEASENKKASVKEAFATKEPLLCNECDVKNTDCTNLPSYSEKDNCSCHPHTAEEQTNKRETDFALRNKCSDLLCQALREPTECKEKTQNLAKEIEENIYTLHAGNNKKYKNCIRSKISNLTNPKNLHLKVQVLSGTLSPKKFAEMGVMEMACDELRNLRENYTRTCVQEHQLPQAVNGVQTNKIRCQRCEKSNCTVTMVSRGTLFLPGWVRTGNPDEEMMTFVICNECGEKWYHSRWVCL